MLDPMRRVESILALVTDAERARAMAGDLREQYPQGTGAQLIGRALATARQIVFQQMRQNWRPLLRAACDAVVVKAIALAGVTAMFALAAALGSFLRDDAFARFLVVCGQMANAAAGLTPFAVGGAGFVFEFQAGRSAAEKRPGQEMAAVLTYLLIASILRAGVAFAEHHRVTPGELALLPVLAFPALMAALLAVRRRNRPQTPNPLKLA